MRANTRNDFGRWQDSIRNHGTLAWDRIGVAIISIFIEAARGKWIL